MAEDEDRTPFVTFTEEHEDQVMEENRIIELTIDEVLNKIGFGRYHVMFMIVLLFFGIFLAYPTLIMVFGDDDPPWKCVPITNSIRAQDGNLTKAYISTCNISGIIKPGNKHFNSRCSMKRHDWMFVHDKRYSMVTEFDLVCDKAVWNAIGKSMLFIFWGFGCLLLGQVGDFFGRKPVLFVTFTLMAIIGMLEAFITTLWQFLVLRALLGLSISQLGLMNFIIPVETVAPRQRALLCNIGGLFFTLGLILLDVQAYYIMDWRNLQLISTVPYFVLLASWCFIPESPRWLLANGKFEKTYKLLAKITTINKKKMPPYTLFSTSSSIANKPPYVELLRNSILRKRTILQGVSWFVVAMTYYGLSFGSSDLGGSFYVNFALVSLCEVPASFVSAFALNRFGRQKSIVAGMILCGISCLLVAAVPLKSAQPGYHIARVVLGMLGKFFATFCFSGYYIWCAELYPTTIRSRGIGVVIFCSRLGAGSAPFVVDMLRKVGPSLAFVFMGVCSIGAAVISFFLPETNKKPMVETIDDLQRDIQLIPNTMNGLEISLNGAGLHGADSEVEIDNGDAWCEDEEDFLLT